MKVKHFSVQVINHIQMDVYYFVTIIMLKLKCIVNGFEQCVQNMKKKKKYDFKRKFKKKNLIK